MKCETIERHIFDMADLKLVHDPVSHFTAWNAQLKTLAPDDLRISGQPSNAKCPSTSDAVPLNGLHTLSWSFPRCSDVAEIADRQEALDVNEKS